MSALTKCPACELEIPVACRRCKRPYRAQTTEVQPAELQLALLQVSYDALVAENERLRALKTLTPQLFSEVLPSMAKWRNMLLEEAVRRVGKVCAGELIGIGRTTVYRMLREAQNATP